MNEIKELVFTIDGDYGRLNRNEAHSIAEKKYTIDYLLSECDDLYNEYEELEAEKNELENKLEEANAKIEELENKGEKHE